MKKFLTVFLVVGILGACSCNVKVGNGKIVVCKGAETLRVMDALTDFDAIVANGAVDLDIRQADGCSVTVEANSEVFDYLDFTVSNGKLVLDTKDHVNIKADKYEIRICAPVLSSITFNGAVDGEMKNYTADSSLDVVINGAGDWEMKSISVPSLTVSTNGAADLEIENLDTDTLSLEINGAGDAVLSGRADKAKFVVNGAGSIDARRLQIVTVETSKHGVASIRL